MKASHPRQLKLAVLSLAIDWIGSHSRKLKRLICLLAFTQFWCGKLSRLVKITTPQITILCLFAQFCHCQFLAKEKKPLRQHGEGNRFEMDWSKKKFSFKLSKTFLKCLWKFLQYFTYLTGIYFVHLTRTPLFFTLNPHIRKFSFVNHNFSSIVKLHKHIQI